MYGAADPGLYPVYSSSNSPDGASEHKRPEGQTWVPGKRKRLNLVGIAVNILIPPFFFAGIFWALAFQLRYNWPSWAWSTVVLGLAVTGTSFLVNRFSKGREMQPMWYRFFTMAMFAGVVLGSIAGDYIYKNIMEAALDFRNLNSYPAVDPSRQKGQQLMDAGRIFFADGTHLELSKSMGFQNFEEYCVAPIVKGGDQLDSYDFWAVGVGCCDNPRKEFRCGEYNNPHAISGLRFLDEGKRPFFRLAVQQAEAAYGIRARHPLFFTWTQDPLAIVSAQVAQAYRLFFYGILSYFVLNLFFVIVAIVGFAKIGHFGHA